MLNLLAKMLVLAAEVKTFKKNHLNAQPIGKVFMEILTQLNKILFND